jgi:ABC-2 type transport system ATP-binding protein
MTIYQAKQLAKRYANFQLKAFDLEVKLGEISGVVGENAAGKTTLLRLIAHDLLPSGGEHQYFFNKAAISPWLIAENHIAYITQELPEWKGIMRDAVLFAAAKHGLSPAESIAATDAILDELGIADLANRRWSEISGGYKLRFTLAQALVWKPQLVILDEPLANLDINTQTLVLDILKTKSQDEMHPMAVLISSQHLFEIENISDNLIYVKDGEIQFSGKKNELENQRISNVFELLCDASKEHLQTILTPLGLENIRSVNHTLVLTFPISRRANEVLKELIDNEIDIVYFRNISQSSKKLLIHE